MTFYNEMAAVARDLLGSFGQEVQITREVGGDTHPVTGVTTPGTVQTFTPMGVLRPYPTQAVDGTLIQQGDRLLVLDDTIEPKMSDKVEVGGVPWSIINIETVNPAGTSLVYRLQVRA